MEYRFAWRLSLHVLQLRLQHAGGDRQVAPANHPITPQQRQSVVAEFALGCGRIGLEAVGPIPEQFEAATVPDHRIERCQQAHALIGFPAPAFGTLIRWPQPVDAVHACTLQTLSRTQQRRLACGIPLRHAATQVTDQLAQAGIRQGRVLVHDHVDQCVQACVDTGLVHGHGVFAHGIGARAAGTPGHAQQAAIVHAIQQLGAGIGRTTKPVGGLAVGEVRIDFARMHGPAFGDEFAHRLRLLPARRRPGLACITRMHQCLVRARQEAVVDEEILFQRQARIAPLQLTGPVADHAMAQGQVLRTRRGADRVRLHETEFFYRTHQRGRLEQRTRNGVTAQVVQGQWHAAMISNKAQASDVRPRPESAYFTCPALTIVPRLIWHDAPSSVVR